MTDIAWPLVQETLRVFVVNSSGIADGSVIWSQQGRGRPGDPWISLNFTNNKPTGGVQVNSALAVLAVNVVITVNVGLNTLSAPNHGLVTGDGPVQVTAGVVMPVGLAPFTNYWVIVLDPNTIRLATSFLGATAGTAVSVTSTGTGAITVVGQSTCTRAGQDLVRFARQQRLVTLSVQCFAPNVAGVVDAVAILGTILASVRLPGTIQTLRAAGVGVSRTKIIRSTGGVIQMTQFEPRAIGEIDLFLASEVSGSVGFIAEVRGTGAVPAATPPPISSGRIPNS